MPILVLAALTAVASGAAATSVDVEPTQTEDGALALEYGADDQGLETRGMVGAALGIPFFDGYAPLFVIQLEQRAAATPEETRIAGLIPFIVPLETALASEEATAPAAAEIEAVREEGASTSADATASEDGAQASAHMAAGNQEFSEEASAPAPDTEDGLLGGGERRGAEYASVEEPAAVEPETGSEDVAPPQPFIAPAAMSASSESIAPIQPGVPEAVATGVAVASMTGSTLVFFPGARHVALRWLRRVLGLALFSRIAQEDVLTHGRRAELFEFIKQNPGERIENARRALGISNGSMHYHLKVLTERNLIRVLRDGGLARLYPAGPKINPQPYVPAQRRRFVDLLSSRPGVTQREAASLLGISERMASYHIQTLAGQGLVEVRPEGARKRLFLRCDNTPAPTPIFA